MVTMTNNMQEAIEKVKDFVMKKNMQHVLEGFVSYMIPHRSDLRSVLTVGGGSYTDGKTVVVGIPEWLFESGEEDIFLTIRALAIHECQHVNSSDFNLYVEYQSEMEKWYAENYPAVPKNVVLTAARYVGNGTEDGRIERIAANRRPGTLRPLKFFRGIWWKNQPMNGKSEFSEFLFAIVTLATMGLMPKEFGKHWSGTRAEEQIDRLRPLIGQAVMAVTSQDHIQVCRNIMKAIAPYLEEMVEEMPPEMQQFAEQEAEENPDFQGTPDEEETGEANGRSTHFGQVDPGSDTDDGQSEDEGDGNDDGDDAEQDEQGEENGAGQSAQQQDEKKEGQGRQSASQKNQDSGKPGDEKDESSKSESRDDKRDRKNPGKNDGDSVEHEIGEILDELYEDARNMIKKAMRDKIREERKHLEDHELDEAERDELVHRAGGVLLKNLSVNKMDSRRLIKPPLDIIREGKKLRRDVEQILRNKEALNLRNQKRGVIDPANLYKVGMKDHNIFMQKGSRNETDYAAFLLWDASGSMTERVNGVPKKESSSRAVAIAEEALKGLVPFKIMQYTADYEAAEHTVIKDFDQSERSGSFAWTRFGNRWVMSGNRDGLAIRHASEELLKRQEQGKLLVIFSDGMPSAYMSQDEARTDVQAAVKEARKAGIHVVTVLFGSNNQIEHLKDDFKFMYDRNIIFADPNSLTRHLSRTLKETMKR